MTDTRQQRTLDMLKAVSDIIVESVQTAGIQGIPGGSIYAALMAYGCSFDTFNYLMVYLLATGRLRKQGQLYFALTEEKS